MNTISQVDVNGILHRQAARGVNDENLLRRFVLEGAWGTRFFKDNNINPIEWVDDDDLIERNQLVIAINKWFIENYKQYRETGEYNLSKRDIWSLVKEYYTSLKNGGYIE